MSKTNEPDISPRAIDAINGRLNTADTEERGLTVGYAPLPNENSLPTIKARRLREFDEMKRKVLRARQQ
jgi:hypothetical protein